MEEAPRKMLPRSPAGDLRSFATLASSAFPQLQCRRKRTLFVRWFLDVLLDFVYVRRRIQSALCCLGTQVPWPLPFGFLVLYTYVQRKHNSAGKGLCRQVMSLETKA